jgi:exodeoxyribonuclease V beta subunit
VLIGDPKQAIYGFRGADVHTYVAACRDIAARGGAPTVALTRNHRSTPEVIAPLNAILEQEAFSPFFDEGDIRYDQPVVATRPPGGARPGITLLRVEPPTDQRKPRIGEIRAALRNAIAEQIISLSREESDLRLSDIAVLTRSNADGRDVAARLRTSGIPSTLFKAEYLFESGEAGAVRAVLAAIADPDDRTARMNAWLTPFFGMDVPALAAGADPPRDHPLMARLLAWAALAEKRAYARLWPAILNDSGITRRLRLSPAGLRALTNIRHLFDRLQAMASERPMSISDLADRLAMLGVRTPPLGGHGRRHPAGRDRRRCRADHDHSRRQGIGGRGGVRLRRADGTKLVERLHQSPSQRRRTSDCCRESRR